MHFKHTLTLVKKLLFEIIIFSILYFLQGQKTHPQRVGGWGQRDLDYHVECAS